MQLLPHEEYFASENKYRTSKVHTHAQHTISTPQRGNECCDEQKDGICFSVTVGALVLITNARRYTTMAKASSKLLPQLWFSLFFFLFSLPFFFLYAPGVNKQEDPVARKTTLYMKPFTPSQFSCIYAWGILSEDSGLSNHWICVWWWLSYLKLLMWAYIEKVDLMSWNHSSPRHDSLKSSISLILSNINT